MKKHFDTENLETKSLLLPIKEFMEAAGQGASKDASIINSCIKAAFVKAYEFVLFAHDRLDDEDAFHCVGILRSICEDLIILKFVSGLPPPDQETVLFSSMLHSVNDSVRRQVPFFATFRPSQPVLNVGYDPTALSNNKTELMRIWQANGWPQKRDGKWPPTEQIAQKVGLGTVDVIYNYIYRLTSGTVHFSARALLRTGWGKDDNHFSFSTKNMGPYYGQFCRVYGLFLLSVYFEFFGASFGMNDKEALAVKALRRSLVMKNRWPEMISFEEMNMTVPKKNVLGLAMQMMLAEEIENGFVAAAEKARES